MKNFTLNAIIFFVGIGLYTLLNAQTKSIEKKEVIQTKFIKPYKVFTNGRNTTIQAIQNLQFVMVWTASGHRIVEARNINQPSYTFTITNKEKIYFVMIEFANGKRYSEKIGMQ